MTAVVVLLKEKPLVTVESKDGFVAVVVCNVFDVLVDVVVGISLFFVNNVIFISDVCVVLFLSSVDVTTSAVVISFNDDVDVSNDAGILVDVNVLVLSSKVSVAVVSSEKDEFSDVVVDIRCVDVEYSMMTFSDTIDVLVNAFFVLVTSMPTSVDLEYLI